VRSTSGFTALLGNVQLNNTTHGNDERTGLPLPEGLLLLLLLLTHLTDGRNPASHPELVILVTTDNH